MNAHVIDYYCYLSNKNHYNFCMANKYTDFFKYLSLFFAAVFVIFGHPLWVALEFSAIGMMFYHVFRLPYYNREYKNLLNKVNKEPFLFDN